MKRLEEKDHTSRMSIKTQTNHTHPEKISVSLSRVAKAIFYKSSNCNKKRDPKISMLGYSELKNSPGGIRTCDQSINSRSLYR